MAAARNRFLSGGWYLPLREAIAAAASERMPERGIFFDSGCGEGYYTAGVQQELKAAGKQAEVCGIDISKFSLRWAAKRDHSIEFAVASAYHLPIPDKSVDFLLNCFSPLALSRISAGHKTWRVFSICGSCTKAPLGTKAGRLRYAI